MKRRSFIPGESPTGTMTLKEKLAHHYAFTEGPGDYFHEKRAFLAGFERAKTLAAIYMRSKPYGTANIKEGRLLAPTWDFEALDMMARGIDNLGEEDVPSG